MSFINIFREIALGVKLLPYLYRGDTKDIRQI